MRGASSAQDEHAPPTQCALHPLLQPAQVVSMACQHPSEALNRELSMGARKLGVSRQVSVWMRAQAVEPWLSGNEGCCCSLVRRQTSSLACTACVAEVIQVSSPGPPFQLQT